MDLVRLRSGRQVAIRPIRPVDGPALTAAHDRLSPQSIYRRYLAPKPHLSLTETRYFVDVDGIDHLALVATPADRPDEIIAVARCIRLAENPEIAEFAIVVGDDHQHQGLGPALMDRLAAAALAHGITHFRATVLAENGPAQALVRGLPGEIVAARHEGVVDEYDVRLAAPTALAA
jgi:GNAT superfamily N-acetyltransferase